MFEALCPLIFLCPEVVCIFGHRECLFAVYFGLECSVQLHPLFIFGGAIAHAPLASSVHHSCPTPARCWRLALAPTIEGRRIDFLLLQHRRGPLLRSLLQAALEQKIGVFSSSLPLSLLRFCLWLLPSSSSLAISGFSSWSFSRPPAMVLTKL